MLFRSLQGQAQDQFEEVNVSSDPPGAMVYVDDKSKGAMGATPLNFKLLPGSYLIICESAGFESGRRKVELKKGAAAQVDFDLVPSAQVGTVNLMVTERDADVLVDKKRVGKSPLPEPLRLKQGSHDLLVTKDGFGNWSQTVEVAAGKTTTLKVDLSGAASAEAGGGGGGGGEPAGPGAPLFTGPRLLPTITMGVGVATIGAGVFMGLNAKHLAHVKTRFWEKLDPKRSQFSLSDGLFMMTWDGTDAQGEVEIGRAHV